MRTLSRLWPTGECSSSAFLQDACTREQLWQVQSSAAGSTQHAAGTQVHYKQPLGNCSSTHPLAALGVGAQAERVCAQRSQRSARAAACRRHISRPSRVLERCNSEAHQSQSRPAARRSSTTACPRRAARWLPQGRCAQRTRRMLRDARAVLPACAARPVACNN